MLAVPFRIKDITCEINPGIFCFLLLVNLLLPRSCPQKHRALQKLNLRLVSRHKSLPAICGINSLGSSARAFIFILFSQTNLRVFREWIWLKNRKNCLLLRLQSFLSFSFLAGEGVRSIFCESTQLYRWWTFCPLRT